MTLRRCAKLTLSLGVQTLHQQPRGTWARSIVLLNRVHAVPSRRVLRPCTSPPRAACQPCAATRVWHRSLVLLPVCNVPSLTLSHGRFQPCTVPRVVLRGSLAPSPRVLQPCTPPPPPPECRVPASHHHVGCSSLAPSPRERCVPASHRHAGRSSHRHPTTVVQPRAATRVWHRSLALCSAPALARSSPSPPPPPRRV